MPRGGDGLRLVLALALAVVVRAPFWAEALRTPLDGDAAIVGLMARRPFESLTLWGQPYGSPLEAWLTAPFVAWLGPISAAVRVPGFLLGLALVPLAFALGRAMHPEAAFPAALLAACPSSYMLLLSAQPPPLYPTALALGACLLLGALSLGRRLAAGEVPLGALLLWGFAAGAALWTHLMTASLVLACLVHLLARAPRGSRGRALALLPMLALGSAPAWVPALAGRATALAVGPGSSLSAAWSHALALAARLHEPLLGLLGAHTPLVADAGEPLARTPAWAAIPLVGALAALLLSACVRRRSRPGTGMLLGVGALTLLAFLFSRRAEPQAIRFLTPLYLPLLALAAAALVETLGARRCWLALAPLAALNLAGGATLLAAWRSADRAAAPFHLPELGPVVRLLESRGIRRAYGSYGPAYRLSYESGESLVVSQFRNERFPEYPLPYLDEVRLASRVAWVFTPQIPSDMPTPAAFENDLRAAGGQWERVDAGAAVVFLEFVPPLGPEVEPLASAGRAGDGDLSTGLTQTGPGGLTLELDPPRELEGVTLAAPLSGASLPPSFDLLVSTDGVAFEVVARRRGRRGLRDLVWSGAQPQYLAEPGLLSLPLRRLRARAIRVIPVADERPWALGEVLVHSYRTGPRASWDDEDDLPLAWAERRAALLARPRPDRVDWYYRMLVVAQQTGVRS
jgi:hypothetical protein